MNATPTPDLDAILTDERIGRMRSQLLTDTYSRTGDSRRANTRKKRAVQIGAAAAGIAIVVAAGVGIGVTQQDRESDTSSSNTLTMLAPGAADGARTAAGTPVDQSGPTDQSGTESSDSRQVITTGSASVTTDDPRAAAQRLARWVESVGGRVDDRAESAEDGDTATLTIRVPSDRVTSTTDQLESYGTVDRLSISKRDVTAAVADLDARISALQVSVARLTEIMSRADTSEALIAAETALTDRQSQLEQLQSERRQTSEQIALSTLDVTFTQQDSAQPEGFLGSIASGWQALVACALWLLHALGILLPWIAVLAALLALWWLARKLIGSRRNRGVE